MKKNTFILLVFLLSVNWNLYSQISSGGQPESFNQLSLKSIAVFRTPDFDYQKLLIEDKGANKEKAYRYGKTHQVNLSPENSGTWQNISGDEKIWQLKINSKGAYSISLIFNGFKLAKGARIYVYSSDKTRVIGAFTDNNNKKDGWFSTAPIAGEEIVLELNVPKGIEYGELKLSGIVHDYKNAFGLKLGYGSSGSCNVNINCAEGADWQNEKRAVVKYIASGLLCTGVLINNTSYDAKPYLLTANHCVSSSSSASSGVFMFNYESENCTATADPAYQSISSANLIATGNDLDFSLLELSTSPPKEFDVYYAGWNRKTVPATNTVCIHHPSGDIKKISIDNNAPEIDNYGSGYVFNSHWKVLEWDLGTTEGGSSGSPLFDENHLIVGDLTGGEASCSYNYNDYYARFDMSWDYHSESAKQLKAWLDPLNSGVEVLAGFAPNLITNGVDAALNNVNAPKGIYCAENEMIPEYVIQNKGTIDLTSAVVRYQVNNGTIVSQLWSGNLKTLETETVAFEPIFIPTGNGIFKAFVSAPNGTVDENHYNDTLSTEITGQVPITEVVIDGAANTCLPKLNSTFSTEVDGKYLWKLSGGEIEGADTLQYVDIMWNEWGVKKINLNVTNYCNSLDAETVEINVVEHSLALEIQLGENGESVCWSIEDCDSNIIIEECVLPSNTKYNTTICVPRGCYRIILKSGDLGVLSFSLVNMYDNQTITAGTAVSGRRIDQFNLNASNGLANFNLYPNPASSELVIEAGFMELYNDASFALYNLNGARLTPFNNLDERKVIDISNLPKGLYIIKIVSVYGNFSKKFLKP